MDGPTLHCPKAWQDQSCRVCYTKLRWMEISNSIRWSKFHKSISPQQLIPKFSCPIDDSVWITHILYYSFHERCNSLRSRIICHLHILSIMFKSFIYSKIYETLCKQGPFEIEVKVVVSIPRKLSPIIHKRKKNNSQKQVGIQIKLLS